MRFTSEFGMDSGGSTSLWSPDKLEGAEAPILYCLKASGICAIAIRSMYIRSIVSLLLHITSVIESLRLYGQASRAISMG